MSTSAILTPPTTDSTSENEETKFHLHRPSGATGILPSPGTRRFSKMYVSRAMGMDSTLDAYPSEDQSPFDDGFDIYSEECWRRWTR